MSTCRRWAIDSVRAKVGTISVVDDTRDMSWLGGPAPPPRPASERRLAVLVKDARSIQLFERAHPVGRELRCLMASDALLFTRVFRAGDDAGFERELAASVDALRAVGWQLAE